MMATESFMLERTGFKLFIEFKLKLYFYFVCNSL